VCLHTAPTTHTVPFGRPKLACADETQGMR